MSKPGAVTFVPQTFDSYNMPQGWLVKDPACHALFFYYLLARKNFEEETTGLIFENENDPKFNYTQLFTSIALAYGVEPERMIRFWLNVDKQCDILSLPKLTYAQKYRMDQVAAIRSQ